MTLAVGGFKVPEDTPDRNPNRRRHHHVAGDAHLFLPCSSLSSVRWWRMSRRAAQESIGVVFRNLSSCLHSTGSNVSLQFVSANRGTSCYSTLESPLLPEERDCQWSQPLASEEEESARRIRTVVFTACNGKVEDIVRSLSSDQSCSTVRLTPRLVDCLLLNFGDDWKSALGLFRWASSHLGYKHTPYGYDKMVDTLGKMKQMELMWGLVQEMHDGGNVTLETVAKVMRRLTGAGRWRDAIKLFDDLESLGFDRNTDTMNILLDTLCKEKNLDIAREVFLELKAHIPPSAYTFNIFVHGWCNARRIDEAIWTIQEMKGYGFRPSTITYTTIIQAYCNRSNVRRARELLDEMVADGCAPNIITYTILLRTLSKSGNIDEVMSLVQSVNSSGCKPDTLFYNFLIRVLGGAGRLMEASRIFELEMEMNGITRNLATYNTMIRVFCDHSQEQNALNVLKELESSSLRPDLATYIPLIKLCFKSSMSHDRLENFLSDIVNKHNLSLDLDTYTLVIHGLCREGRIEQAWLLFDEMITREILPMNQTCQLLMYEAEQKGIQGAVERIKSLIK